MALSTQARPRQIRAADADPNEYAFNGEFSHDGAFPEDTGFSDGHAFPGDGEANPDAGDRYAVATIIVQAGNGADTTALTAIATQLADDVRRALRHGAPLASVSATVAVSTPSRLDSAGPDSQPPAATGLDNDLDSADRIVVDRAHRYAAAGGHVLDLTYREFELLAFLVEHPGRAFSREHLLRTVWDHAEVGSRTVDVHVRRLRVKLDSQAHRLTTIRNVGYRLEPQDGSRLSRALSTVA